MATLKHSISVDIRELDLRVSPTLRYLDLGALAKAKRAEIAIGEIEPFKRCFASASAASALA
jgi:hypothetical protein